MAERGGGMSGTLYCLPCRAVLLAFAPCMPHCYGLSQLDWFAAALLAHRIRAAACSSTPPKQSGRSTAGRSTPHSEDWCIVGSLRVLSAMPSQASVNE